MRALFTVWTPLEDIAMAEEYGYSLKPVPREQRSFGFLDNFAIWFGADMGIAVFWAGALLTPSLSLRDALIAIIIGHVVGNLLMGLVGLMGARTGVPTMVLVRGALGVRGSYLPSILNYIQLVGWTAVMIVVAARAMDTVYTGLVGGDSPYILWAILFGAAVTLWTIVGPERWKPLEKIAVALLLVLSAWLVYVVTTRFDFWELFNRPGLGGISFWIGLDLVIAMPISWIPLIADYARFSRSLGGCFWGIYIGHFVGSGLCYFLGALTNVAAGLPDPIAIIAAYGLGIPAMLIILFSTTTTTFLDIYSAAITFKNVVSKASVKKQVLVVGTLGTGIALLFPPEQYEWFLLFIGGAFTSLAAIMLADFFLVKRGYDAYELLRKEGSYWYFKGVNVRAVAVWAFGFIFYMLLAASSLLGVEVPVFSHIAEVLGCSLPTLAVTVVLYLALSSFQR